MLTKRVIRFSLFLAAVVGGILIIQWKGYSSSKDAALLNIDQTLSLHHTHDEFVVKQVIDNLPEGKYNVRFPAKAKDIDCQSGEEKTCKWVNERNSKIKINEEPLTFTYKLKAPKKVSGFLLEDWGVRIEEVPSMTTRIQLTEQNWRNGSWAAGAELAGKEKMEAIDYYVFESLGTPPPLYWQEKALVPTEINQHLTFYSGRKPALNTSILKKIVPEEKLFVIMSSHAKTMKETENLIIIPENITEEKLARLLLKRKLSLKGENEWLPDLIASAMSNTPAQNSKVEKMRQTLFSVLTEDQMERWTSSVLSAGPETISSEMLDELLEETAGIRTDFFQSNANMSIAFQPFYFLDKREVYLEGHKADDIKVLFQNDRTFISFIPLVKKLGFRVQGTSNSEEMIIEKAGDKFHFIYSQKLFAKNEQQFGFQKNPFFIDRKDVYLDTAALAELFGLEVKENSHEIKIQ
ncbi:hypothetical protein J1TS3_01890 [Siminovitchia fordii]|uniref:Copper amine oxidase-like N-terminal domain-containing protein n=1 Tax=Siminovitchia fordii TaxID=254759 RepID=A0ABQ4K252_9BACI|nr:hypothetical protein J1TS3_01890 [Siminovitchia fordii]